MRAKNPKKLAKNDPRHGTYNGYGNLHCRCQPCKDANKAYQKEQRTKRWEITATQGLPDYVAHGRKSTYFNWGCHCEECLVAAGRTPGERRFGRQSERQPVSCAKKVTLQTRVEPDLRAAVEAYAATKDISISSAFVQLLEVGVASELLRLGIDNMRLEKV